MDKFASMPAKPLVRLPGHFEKIQMVDEVTQGGHSVPMCL